MKRFLIGFSTTSILLCGLALAQDATTAPATTPSQPQQNSVPQAAPAQAATPGAMQAGAPLRIAPGSVIPVQLTKSIDAKKLKTGDQVEAKVTQDMKAGNGEIIVPKDTKVVGRVTEAQAHSKEQKESQVGIAFDHAVMKDGGDVNLPMSIQAIISPSYLSSNSGAEGSGQKQPEGNGAMPQPSTTNRAGAMGGAQPPTTSGQTTPSDDKTTSGTHQPITGNTQGVLGIPDMTLSSTAGGAQGSLVTSGKNNVKLESGTLMLLRVDQIGSMQK